MSMLFTRDAYDEDRESRIALIGLEAYEKEVKEASEKYDRENPDYVSSTEPHVRRGDVIVTDIQKESVANYKEIYITKVDSDGNIWGRTLTTDPMSDPHMGGVYMWTGPYKVIKAQISEYDTTVRRD